MSRKTEAHAGHYLDWNATTPPLPEVIEAMQRAAAEAWGNPSSVHAEGRRARAVVESAREAVARLCGTDPRDIVLTASATEANNLALRAAPALVTSRLEHPSVVRVAEVLADEGKPVVWLPVPSSGRLDPASVDAAIAGLPAGFVVAVMAANHETGVIQPVREIAERLKGTGGRLHVDAAQAAGKIEPGAWQAGDTLSLAAHKIRGPKGIGALVLRSPGLPKPVLLGGAQERGIRPGTLDPVSAAGFAAAARRALDGPSRYAPLAILRDRIERELGALAVPNGSEAPRLSHVSNLSFTGWNGDELVPALDLAGVHVSSGSACSAGSTEPSPIVRAMVGEARARAAVRISLGDATSVEIVEDAIASILRVLTYRTSRV